MLAALDVDRRVPVSVSRAGLGLADLRRVDREQARLARGNVRDRLALGAVLARLGARFTELGFRTFGMYVRERLSLGPRWCGDTRTLARRLEERPALREALVRGRVGWSMAELLARHSRGDDEAELLAAVEGLTLREVREALRERFSEDVDEEGSFTTLDVSVTKAELAALEATRMGVEHVNGGPGEPGHWLECVLAEGLSTMLQLRPELADDASLDGLCDAVDAPTLARRARGQDGEGWTRRFADEPFGVDELEEEEELSDDPVALDRLARDRAARLAGRDVWLGQLLSRFMAAPRGMGPGWARLGYASEQHYCDERLGMARSTVRARIALARKMVWLEGLDEVVQSGRIGVEHASLVARIANPDTLDGWVERATSRTFKHLREEVRAVELIAQLTDAPPRTLGPPDESELEAVTRFERAVLSGEVIARAVVDAREEAERVRMSVGSAGDGAVRMSVGSEDDAAVRMSVGAAEGGAPERRVGYRVYAREEVVWTFRQLEAAFARSGLPGSFASFLVIAFFDAWGERFLHGNRWKAIHDRDRHRCVSPVCESRNVTNHHLRYRAHGGGDEAENQITLCEFCHLEGEHGGRLKVRGTASHLIWSFGRRPVLRVEGRERVASREAPVAGCTAMASERWERA